MNCSSSAFLPQFEFEKEPSRSMIDDVVPPIDNRCALELMTTTNNFEPMEGDNVTDNEDLGPIYYHHPHQLVMDGIEAIDYAEARAVPLGDSMRDQNLGLGEIGPAKNSTASLLATNHDKRTSSMEKLTKTMRTCAEGLLNRSKHVVSDRFKNINTGRTLLGDDKQSNFLAKNQTDPNTNPSHPAGFPKHRADKPSRKSNGVSTIMSQPNEPPAAREELPTLEDRLRAKRGKSMRIQPIGHPEMTEEDRMKRDYGIYYGKSLKELKALLEARRCFPHSHVWPAPGLASGIAGGMQIVTGTQITYLLQEQDKELTAQDPFLYSPITSLIKRSKSRIVMSKMEDLEEKMDMKLEQLNKKYNQLRAKCQDKFSKK